jgi:ERCC4-type nuclease
MKIQVDSKEKGRVDSAVKYYSDNGHDVCVESLPVGDYIFEDKIVFEYKRLDDFFKSINDGRVFNQSINQFENFDYHFVLIETSDKKLQSFLKKSYYNGHRVTKKQYDGAIQRLNTYTTVIFASTEKKAFKLMENQADKCLDSNYLVKSYPKTTGPPAFKCLCYCVEGVGSNRAELITDALGLYSVKDVLDLDYDELIKIKGIGESTVTNIRKAVNGE